MDIYDSLTKLFKNNAQHSITKKKFLVACPKVPDFLLFNEKIQITKCLPNVLNAFGINFVI